MKISGHVIALTVSAAVTAGSVTLPAFAVGETTEDYDNLKLIDLTFDDENDRLATVHGTANVNGEMTYGTADDGSGCAVFDGSGSSWLELLNDEGKGLLDGKDDITITFRSNTTGKPTWWLFAAPDTAAPTYGLETYLGLFDQQSAFTVERYRNNGTRIDGAASSYTSGAWKDITVTLSETETDLYIDGKLADSKLYDYSLSDMLGDNSIAYLGKATWGTGEYATGSLDRFTVYDFSVIPQIDAENLDENITLPSGGTGYSVTWSSSDESVITSDGVITRPDKGKAHATLTAEITFDNTTLTKDYSVSVLGYDYYDYLINVTDQKGVDIRDNMYGLFFEDINYGADGGLYAEMVENRSFEEIMHKSSDSGTSQTYSDPGYAWSAVSGTMSYATDTPLNENNTHYLAFSGTSFKNKAYEGMNIERGKNYKVSFYAKSDDYTGGITAAAKSNGVTEFSGTVTDSVTDTWTKYEAEITAENSARYCDFIVSLDTAGSVDFDMISVMPSDAVMGVFRRDLAEKLKEMNPGFLRFPGGCIVEGWDIANRYQWKQSVGPVEERVQNWNRWATSYTPTYTDYNQTLGLGFYEYFLLCEYLDCDAVPVLSVGLSCEYQGKETVPMYAADVDGDTGVTIDGVTYSTAFWQYIQDALDLIEFCNGDTDTTWGSVRSQMGHDAPFDLTMLGIGNEQWAITGNQWYERYEAFEKVIHDYYPDMHLISTSGPSADGTSFTDAWNWIRENQAENPDFTYAVDEHYYKSTDWFLSNDTRYDDYDRNTKVFAGEYAANTNGNTLLSAVSEAAYMTGLERNADVVYMASYAPLFCRINYMQWNPDLIWFDDASSYGTPDYYVQKMYMNNNGDYTLESTVTETDDKTYTSVSYDEDTGDIIVKLANPTEVSTCAAINLENVADTYDISDTADVEILTGTAPSSSNSIENPENVAPVTSTVTVSNNMARIIMDAYSFAVVRLHTAGEFEVSLDFDGNIAYTSDYSSEMGCDIYVALYNEDGTLAQVTKNTASGTFVVTDSGNYTAKAFFWDKMRSVEDSRTRYITKE